MNSTRDDRAQAGLVGPGRGVDAAPGGDSAVDAAEAR